MRLSEIWDGELHYFEPAEDFPVGARMVVDGWDELDEDGDLSPFESPSMTPRLRETGDIAKLSATDLAQIQQAWGSLSVTLTSFAQIVGVDKDQFELVNHKDKTRKWSFQTKEHLSERI